MFFFRSADYRHAKVLTFSVQHLDAGGAQLREALLCVLFASPADRPSALRRSQPLIKPTLALLLCNPLQDETLLKMELVHQVFP